MYHQQFLNPHLQQKYDMVGWLERVNDKKYDYLREWHKNTLEEGLLMSSSGPSEDEEDSD